MSFDFLIFDLDGTLVDSQTDITSSLNSVRKEYNLDYIPAELVRSYMSSGIDTLIDKAVPEENGINKLDIVKKFRFYYRQHLTDTTVIYNGVKEMLEILKNKKKVILSNKSEDFSREIVKRLGISKYFVKIWGGDTVGVKKPNPKPIIDLIKLTKSNTFKTLMIGDSANDFLAARAAGISSIAVLYGYSSIEKIKQYNPSFTVRTPGDIINIVL
ncbi:MAG: HAD family hydrolase [Endomicrobium sp.]|jgi:phosphoglycolate phosphatase|nr:HAD family hydrolase [Endomicrobium sp.]